MSREETEMKATYAIQKEMKLETLGMVSKPNFCLMKIIDGSSIEQILGKLNNYSEVEYIDPNSI